MRGGRVRGGVREGGVVGMVWGVCGWGGVHGGWCGGAWGWCAWGDGVGCVGVWCTWGVCAWGVMWGVGVCGVCGVCGGAVRCMGVVWGCVGVRGFTAPLPRLSFVSKHYSHLATVGCN